MAVCQICGCKTDDLDFVESKVGALNKKVCSFCDRQLNALSGDEIGEAQLNWLKAVVSKDVPGREAEVLDALKELLDKQGVQVSNEPAQATEQVEIKQYKANKGLVKSDDVNKDAVIAELTQRVDKLEKALIAMKRAQLIKTVCEIALPIILGIIILIIFFSSGFYNTLSDLYSSFS